MKKILPSKKSKLKSEKFRSFNRKEQFDFSSTRHLPTNLPEFVHFSSDHLIQHISPSSADRSRTSSVHLISKSLGSQTPPFPHSPTKRNSYRSSPRIGPKKFDSMSCFDEVSKTKGFPCDIRGNVDRYVDDNEDNSISLIVQMKDC